MLNEFYDLEYNKDIEEKTIDIRKEIKIKIPDAIIAAAAITYDCTLVTRNVDDFNNLSNLKIFNPFK